MKKTFSLLAIVFFLAGCSPSAGQIETLLQDRLDNADRITHSGKTTISNFRKLKGWEEEGYYIAQVQYDMIDPRVKTTDFILKVRLLKSANSWMIKDIEAINQGHSVFLK